jgi:hypothetical protein
MNFITGKHLSRRTFLRGPGASVALPFLDAMIPASRRNWVNPTEGFTRLVCIEESMGAAGSNPWGDTQHFFAPPDVGHDFTIVQESQLKNLAPYKEYLTIVSNTDIRMAEPFKSEEIGGDHDRSTAVFLTQAHPLQTKADVYIGKSIDQIHADRFGQDTALPSLEITTEEMDRGGGCAYNYHCAYTTSLAWKSATQPLPAVREPKIVFEQLFGAGNSPSERAERLRTNRSLLDFITGELAGLKQSLGAIDRQALEEYTNNIRELERRIALVEKQNNSGEKRDMPEAPTGVPDRWEDHMQLMFDIQVLALQADLTRAITFKTGFDLQNRTFPDSGTSKSFHGASHHGNVPTAVKEFHLINTHRLSQQAYFLEKLKNTKDGEGSLLDKMAILWGSPMGDSNVHAHRRVPLVIMGKANGGLQGNVHLKAPEGTPTANVLVSLMRAVGHNEFNQLGDSTGAFALTAPKTPATQQEGV